MNSGKNLKKGLIGKMRGWGGGVFQKKEKNAFRN